MRCVLLVVFFLLSCQERSNSRVASDDADAEAEPLEQFYFAGFHLRQVVQEQNDDNTSETEDKQVVIKVSVKDNKPHSLMVKDLSSVTNLNSPSTGEVPADSEMLTMAMPNTKVADRLGSNGSRKYIASQGSGDEKKIYELHWFSGTWQQYRDRGSTGDRGPISDSTVARFVLRSGDIEYANDTAVDSYRLGRLPLTAEEISQQYFADADDPDLMAHRHHENLTELCGELLKPYLGYNVYRIEREDCRTESDDMDGFLLVRASVGVASHLAGSSDENAVGCRVDSSGLQFVAGDEQLFTSESCTEQLLDIQTRKVGDIGFLTIKVTGGDDEERTVWLKDNELSNADAYNEDLLAKFREEALGDTPPAGEN